MSKKKVLAAFDVDVRALDQKLKREHCMRNQASHSVPCLFINAVAAAATTARKKNHQKRERA
jgi:hypothetical protein